MTDRRSTRALLCVAIAAVGARSRRCLAAFALLVLAVAVTSTAFAQDSQPAPVGISGPVVLDPVEPDPVNIDMQELPVAEKEPVKQEVPIGDLESPGTPTAGHETPIVLPKGSVETTKSGMARLRVRCAEEQANGCEGTLLLESRSRRTLARRSFSLRAGDSASLKVRVGRAARRTLARCGRLRARARVLRRGGDAVTAVSIITLAAPKARKGRCKH
jgi:hypothetical protein